MTIEEMKEQQTQFTWKTSVERAQERLRGRGIVRFPQPTYGYQELGEVEDIVKLGDKALATMTMRHQGWYSYVTVELAFARAALGALDEIYDVLLGEEMHKVALTKDGRIVKDVLKSLAIQGDELLKTWHQRRIDEVQDVQLLEGMVSGLAIRSKALNDEGIRRASARKVEYPR